MKMKKIILGTLLTLTVSSFMSSTFAFQPPRSVVCDNALVQMNWYEINTSFGNEVNLLKAKLSNNYNNDWNYNSNYYNAMERIANIFDKRFNLDVKSLSDKVYKQCMAWVDTQPTIDKLFQYRDSLEKTIVDSDNILKILSIYLVDWKKGFVKYIRENKNTIQNIKSWVVEYKNTLKLQKQLKNF